MKIIERNNGCVKPEYANSFRTYAGNGEVVLELSRVDLAATLETSTDGADPKEMIVDVLGRFIFRQDQLPQLVNALVEAMSRQASAAQQKGGSKISS